MKYLIFISSMAFCAFVAWLGGYNFDSRTPWVAMYFGFSGVLSLLVSLAYWGISRDS